MRWCGLVWWQSEWHLLVSHGDREHVGLRALVLIMCRGGTAPPSALAQAHAAVRAIVSGVLLVHVRLVHFCVILGSITICFGISTASHEEYTLALLWMFAGLYYYLYTFYDITCPSSASCSTACCSAFLWATCTSSWRP
eukprot:9477637-Pyramimonas_sp.AAC.1